MRLLLVTPPMTQINTPYPATAYLTGFLASRGHQVDQADVSLGLFLRLFSRTGLGRIAAAVNAAKVPSKHPAVSFFLQEFSRYEAVVEAAVRFLQGRDAALAWRLASGNFLPEGPRFQPLRSMQASGQGFDPEFWAFGALGIQDQAKHLASLFVDDLADVIREGVDERFALARYGEKLAASAPDFLPMREALESSTPTLVDLEIDALASALLAERELDILGLSVPFPGNVYGALRIARVVKAQRPEVKVVLGGGYVNTELRDLADPRVFDYVDFITLDDGERPLLNIIEHLQGRLGSSELCRTFVREAGQVCFKSNAAAHDIPLSAQPAPTYKGLDLTQYVSLNEMLNPMQRLWSDGRWNKLTLAHGCYWRQCSFCDTGLDYIARYEDQAADVLVDKIEAMVRESGVSGFHFVDEAAPPRVLLALARRLKERGVVISFWANIRFEKTFTPAVAKQLADAGMVAVSGGLEVASDRLLELMNKGVTVAQVARVTRAFADAGILVHAYLMYGFPTQTTTETVEALERVRQLFAAGCLHSAFWHRFSATIHSPVGRRPEAYGIALRDVEFKGFARNDVPFVDPTPTDHDLLGQGLRRAVYNYMHGLGLDEDVRAWFDVPLPRPKVKARLVEAALAGEDLRTKASAKTSKKAKAEGPAHTRHSSKDQAWNSRHA